MRTITTNIYTFDELPHLAQARAIQDYRLNGLDIDYDCTIEDAKTIGVLAGIAIDEVYFSGFWSQGDGACFSGSFEPMSDALQKVKLHAPMDAELHDIVSDIAALDMGATITHSGHYMHSGCMDIDTDSELDYQPLRWFADWVYGRLRDTYDYCTSDEYISESIRANGLEFTFTGDPK